MQDFYFWMDLGTSIARQSCYVICFLKCFVIESFDSFGFLSPTVRER